MFLIFKLGSTFFELYSYSQKRKSSIGEIKKLYKTKKESLPAPRISWENEENKIMTSHLGTFKKLYTPTFPKTANKKLAEFLENGETGNERNSK